MGRKRPACGNLKKVGGIANLSLVTKTESSVQQLTIVPFGGLCNRLRATISARYVSERIGKPVRVRWCSDFECAAHFDELFEPIDTPQFSVVHQTFFDDRPRRRNFRIPTLLRHLSYGHQKEWLRPWQGDDIFEIAARAERVWVSSCHELCDIPDACYAALRPLPAIADAIRQVTAPFQGLDVVGIHIRRTDHTEAIADSSTQDFRRVMDAERARNGNVAFYLATDDLALRRELQRAYGDRVFVQPLSSVRRDTREGIMQAVTDLYALAATSRIYGSTASTFTITAAKIGGIPLLSVKETDKEL